MFIYLGNFLCKSCGETVASSRHLHHYDSLDALKVWNQTLVGIRNVPIQVFQNPNGNMFNVLTFSTCKAHSFEEVIFDIFWSTYAVHCLFNFILLSWESNSYGKSSLDKELLISNFFSWFHVFFPINLLEATKQR